MSCRSFQKLISKLEDGILREEEKRLLYEHCKSCASCREDLLLTQRLDQLLNEYLQPVDPPADFTAKVMRSLPEKAEKRSLVSRTVLWRSAGLAAAALFLVISVTSLDLWPSKGNDIAVDNPDNPPDIVIADNNNDNDYTDPGQDNDNNTDTDITVNNNDTDTNTDNDSNTDTENSGTPSTDPGQENNSQSNTETENNQDSGEVNLPIVASNSRVWGDFNLTLLSENQDSDVLLPEITEDGQIEYLTQKDGKYQLWQKSISSDEAAVLLEADYTGSLKDRESYVGENDYCVAVSPDGTMVAANANGESTDLWISDNNSDADPTVYCESAGGSLLSWAPNSGKLVFDDTNGDLYVVYPAEKVVLLVFEGKVDSVAWITDSRTLIFSAKDSDDGYSKLYQVTLP